MLKLARTSMAASPEASVNAVFPRGKLTPACDVSSDVKVTVAPDTGLSNLSRTVTRRLLKALPTWAVCGVPAVAVIVAGVEDGVTVVPPKERMSKALVAAWGGAYRGIRPVVKPVRT